ncbi:hypothetical protein [Euzebya rosea]|uniref:hypothetical protein n=1 Tax=Euzebya rosea TaxID=2052804 RepID=UPI000D3E675C|nr:hypothetical protein [Euzebya rosea]
MSAPSTIPTAPDTTSAPTGNAPEDSGTGRRIAIVATVVAVAVLAFFGLTRLGLGNDAADVAAPDAAPDTALDAAPLELSLGEGDALASCMALDVAVLAGMSPALAATATTVDGEAVTLSVDRWYAGGDADTVVLHAPAGLQALIGGIDFVVGEQYLITASDGIVNYCGYSGPASPELTAAFDEAFGA